MPKLIGCSQDMGESKTAQIKMGLRHFLFFINSNIQLQETWWPILGKGPITDPDSIPRAFFTTSNIDKFGHYMADYARHYVGDVQSGNKNMCSQYLLFCSSQYLQGFTSHGSFWIVQVEISTTPNDKESYCTCPCCQWICFYSPWNYQRRRL